MVNGLSGVGQSYPSYSKQLDALAKYATGTALASNQLGVTDGVGTVALFGLGMEGFKGLGWLNRNFKTPIDPNLPKDATFTQKWNNYKGWDGVKTQWATDKLAAKTQATNFYNTFQASPKLAMQNFWADQRMKSVLNSLPNAGKLEKLAKVDPSFKTTYAEVEKLAKAGKLKEANKLLAEANSLTHGAIKPTGFFGKMGAGVSKYTGLDYLGGKVKNFATKSPATAKMLKMFKGNGLYAGILAATAIFTEIIPTFASLGAAKGTKQVGKSAVKAGAEIGGWVVGAKAGAIAGAAIGTMIPIPVVGTVVGALCGLVGGLIGCNLAGKAAKAVVGKNEMEIAQDKQAKQLAQQAQNDPELMNELLAYAQARMQEEGPDSPEAQEILKIIQPNYNQKNIFAA